MSKIKIGVTVTSLFNKLSREQIRFGVKILSEFFEVSLFLPTEKPDIFGSVSVESRIKSINDATSKCEVILSLCGGFNEIELLQNFDKLKFNKENIFVGQSDNTLLVNALPTLGICKSLYGKGFYNIATNKEKAGPMAQELYESILKLKFESKTAGARLIGGNNYTFDLLQGTRFSPDFSKPFVLFMEGEDILKDPTETWVDFIRNIDSVMLQKAAKENLRGLVIGKFPDSIKVSKKQLDKYIDERSYLKNMPIVIDYPCGHNKESLKYLPIGENISIKMLNLKERK